MMKFRNKKVEHMVDQVSGMNMSRPKICIFFLLLALLLTTGCVKEVHYTLVINPDGSSSLKQIIALDRKTVEQGMAARNRYESNNLPAKEETLSSEELEKRIRSQFEERIAQTLANTDLDCQLETIDIKEDNITLSLMTTSPDLETLVGNFPNLLSELPDPLLVIWQTEEQHLEVSLTPRMDPRYQQQWVEKYSDMFSAFQVKFSVSVEMPGEVLSSSLEENKENVTQLVITSWDESSIANFQNLLREGIQVVAKSGGLKLSVNPLDSDELANMAYNKEQEKLEQSLPPITEAGPGYIAVPIKSHTARTLHYAEGLELFGEDIVSNIPQEEVTDIQGRVFLPKGRLLFNASDLKLVSGRDDHGRKVLSEEKQSEKSIDACYFVNDTGSGQDVSYASFALKLNAPPKDSRAIDEIQLEAVLTTFSRWKKYEITGVSDKQKQPVDLSNVIKTATLTVTEIEVQDDDGYGLGHIKLEISGPPEIGRLNYQLYRDASNPFYSEITSREISNKDGLLTHKIALQFSYDASSEQQEKSYSLLVKLPTDMKRERLKFALHDLDLY